MEIDRRTAMKKMAIGGGAVAGAWAIPEILTAKPVGGATLSFPTIDNVPQSSVAPPEPQVTHSVGHNLATTGAELEKTALGGFAAVATGFAMHHWASRKPTPLDN